MKIKRHKDSQNCVTDQSRGDSEDESERNGTQDVHTLEDSELSIRHILLELPKEYQSDHDQESKLKAQKRQLGNEDFGVIFLHDVYLRYQGLWYTGL